MNNYRLTRLALVQRHNRPILHRTLGRIPSLVNRFPRRCLHGQQLKLVILNEHLVPFKIVTILNVLGLRMGPFENDEPVMHRTVVHSCPFKICSRNCPEKANNGKIFNQHTNWP